MDVASSCMMENQIGVVLKRNSSVSMILPHKFGYRSIENSNEFTVIIWDSFFLGGGDENIELKCILLNFGTKAVVWADFLLFWFLTLL